MNPTSLLHNITYQRSISEIPWAFDQSDSHLVQWQAKFAAYMANLQARLERVEAELRKVDLLPTTKERLKTLQNAYKNQILYINTLLPDFKASSDALMILRALEDRIPSGQHIESYFNNIFRDWAWGDSETKIAQKLLAPYFSEISDELISGSILNIGAGACRLPLELHLEHKPKESIALDINPLLMIVAKKLLSGEKINLFEFPHPAASLEDAAHKHELKTHLRQPENFHFIFADGLNLPVPDKSCDVIFTPWFIDIVPMSLDDLAARMNFALKNGGVWINFGPLGFQDREKSSSYTFKEVQEVLSEQGFLIEKCGEEEIPYMHSPFSAQKRTEKVYLFRVRKNKEVKKRPRFRYLPEHLSDPTKPFPFSHDIAQTAQNARITADLTSLIDGKKSLQEIAQLISQHSNVSEKQALDNLLVFFVNLFEKTVR